MVKVKSHELRAKGKEELLSTLDQLKMELSELRVAQVTGGPASKVAKIKTTRKSVAKVLTVLNNNQRTALRKLYRGKKFAPVDIKRKQTRAKRRALTYAERSAVTARTARFQAAYPQRRFALAL
eukprot:TRINITY_DN451_c0_g1_i1.p1 TRINITY_DN451_c0_g1~~TRINITY_DN451_c0_g1_i1.p1  ORF type:complete len:124 (+),score=31.49 TRINITY_DN451_c0_g1_i1:65-436(+)